MRQIGTLENAQDANRFTAYLIVEKIRAMVEQEGEKFAVWIREENDVPRAKEEFSAFVANPADERYQNKEREAHEILRAELAQRARGQKNVVNVREQSTPLIVSRRSPLCLALLGLSVVITLYFFSERGNMGDSKAPVWGLFFADRAGVAAAENLGGARAVEAAFSAIARGEVWRLVTPIFIHMSWPHLIFNTWGLLIMGARLETRFGAFKLSLWVLAIAIFSNIAQALFVGPNFGGLSGVIYGILGIAWVYTRFSGERSALVAPQETFWAMLWLVMCFVLSSDWWGEAMGKENQMHIANTAHAAGLLFGAAIGLVLSWKRS